MSADFYEGVFAGLACVLTGALITFVVMATRPPKNPPPPEPYQFDTLLPPCPDDPRGLVEPKPPGIYWFYSRSGKLSFPYEVIETADEPQK